MPEQAILILGAGGHGRVLASALLLGGYRVIGFLDAAESTWGSRCLDLPVFGNDERLADFPPGQVQLANGIGSVGLPALRRRIFGAQRAKGYNFASVIHPRAIVSPDVELGHGVQVMAGAVIQTGARIGDNVIVNTGAIVDHDCVIGAHCLPAAEHRRVRLLKEAGFNAIRSAHNPASPAMLDACDELGVLGTGHQARLHGVRVRGTDREEPLDEPLDEPPGHRLAGVLLRDDPEVLRARRRITDLDVVQLGAARRQDHGKHDKHLFDQV